MGVGTGELSHWFSGNVGRPSMFSHIEKHTNQRPATESYLEHHCLFPVRARTFHCEDNYVFISRVMDYNWWKCGYAALLRVGIFFIYLLLL